MIMYTLTGIIFFIVITFLFINNQIVVKKNKIKEAFGSIDVYFKKRFDLLPNLVAVVNKYAEHEKELLAKIIQVHTKSENAIHSNNRIETSNELSELLHRLNAATEKYTHLKADKQFLLLQHNLTDLEEQLSAARRSYNAAVTDYNDTIQMFPASLIANIRNDKTNKILKTPEEEKQNIRINDLLS